MSKPRNRVLRPGGRGLVAAGVILIGLGWGSGVRALDVGEGPRGPSLLIYGNYCGPGNRGPRYRPIDALDRACAHHDACWPGDPAILPTCACNERLHGEAGLVAQDRRAPPETRRTAQVIADFAAAIPCDDGAGPRLRARR